MCRLRSGNSEALSSVNPILKPSEPAKVALTYLGVLTLLASIGLMDWAITSEFSVSLLYLVPTYLAAWFLGLGAGITLSALAALVWYLAEAWVRPPFDHSFAVVWQSLSRFGFYLLTAFLVDRIRLLTLNLEALVQARTLALQTEVLRRKELEREAAEISEREQERIAHELHDELAAYMTGIAFRAKTIAEDLDHRGAPEANDADNLVKLINCAGQQVRSFSRLLAPLESSQTDLSAALCHLGNEVETAFRITCTVEMNQKIPELTNEQCSQLYRIAQEAVRNAIQHSEAELVRIRIRLEGKHLRLSIQCNGKAWERSPQPFPGMGLRIMEHRTQRLGGKLSVQPRAGGGALVTCDVPINAGSTQLLSPVHETAQS